MKSCDVSQKPDLPVNKLDFDSTTEINPNANKIAPIIDIPEDIYTNPPNDINIPPKIDFKINSLVLLI